MIIDITTTRVANKIITNKNIKYNEKMLLIGLISYYDKANGYAAPKYEQLMNIMGTTRRELISKTLKKLVEHEYIKIEKQDRKNVYYILIDFACCNE